MSQKLFKANHFPIETYIISKNINFQVNPIIFCGYSKLVSRDAWTAQKGMILIRPPGTAKNLQNRVLALVFWKTQILSKFLMISFWAVWSYCDASLSAHSVFWEHKNVKFFKELEIFRMNVGDQKMNGLTWKLIFLLIIYVSMGKLFALNHFWKICFFEQP